VDAVNAPKLFSDFAGLEELKSSAAAKSPDATPEAARQFEALFVQMMLKSMRDASNAFSDDSDKSYRDMFDQQISLEMTRGKGLGLADMLTRQLAANAGTAPVAPAVTPIGADDRTGVVAISSADLIRRAFHGVPYLAAPKLDGISPTLDEPSPPVIIDGSAAAASAAADASREDWRPQSALEFLRDLLPHAQKAAEQLGVGVRAILAHAALETGWGQSVIRDGGGKSSNNLFNIKAGAQWAGEQVRVKTLEFVNGVAELKNATFKAYPNLAAAFGDYVKLLTESPRYANALRNAVTPEAFGASLQKAGYATDPDYAAKLRSILASPRFNGLIGQLKNVVELPIP
jgi:peptidoglycan hydrolase FlgJ